MKKIFLLLFILFIIAYILLSQQRNIIAALMPHFAIFCISVYFIYEKSFSYTLKKLGIPGNIKDNLKYWLFGFISVIVFTILLGLILSHYAGVVQDSNKVHEKIKEFPIYLLVFAIFLAPISEELFFRGLLTNFSSKYLPDLVDLVPQAVLFGILHFAYGSKLEIFATFVIGLIFGYIYKRSKSLMPSILIHATYNLFSILIIMSLA